MNKELTVLTPQSEETFYQYYGNHIMSKFPGLTFNVVSSNNDNLYEDESFLKIVIPTLLFLICQRSEIYVIRIV